MIAKNRALVNGLSMIYNLIESEKTQIKKQGF